jgi:flagellar hook-associated protein 3 FlgL
VLATISADLRSGSGAKPADLTALDAAMRTVETARSDVGARYNRVQSMQTAAQTLVGDLGGRLSAVEDVDLPSTIVSLQLQQNAYQAALGATSKALSLSLADFLR